MGRPSRGRRGTAAAVLLCLAAALLQCHRTSAAQDTAKTLEVFIVPHSHCDTGYKKTTEGYYLTEVRWALNSVTDYLQSRPDLRFIWAEGAYLWRWWRDEPTRFAVFKRLVERGQIELVGGGWTMHDEAITSYDEQVTQMRMGHELLRYLGFAEEQLPRIGWQPDPFGPSSWTPTLMALSGFDAWVTNRLPEPIKEQLRQNQTLQFVWHGSSTLSAHKSAILTHVLDTHYESPAGFDWEPPVPNSQALPVTSDNVADRADAFVNTMAKRAQWYRTPLLLVPLGGDFEYQNASINFGNMSAIMDFVASQPDRYVSSLGLRVRLRYSTLSEYFARLHDLNPSLPVLRSSPFLPLVSGEGGMTAASWSGYYSGYPTLKEAARRADTLLRTAEALLSLAGPVLSPADREALQHARRNVNLMPHHDNLPATGYNFNNVDLEVNLRRACASLEAVIAKATSSMATPDGSPGSMTTDPDVLRTIDDGQALVPVVLVNSAGWSRSEVVEVRVSRQDLMVTDAKGQVLPSQVLKESGVDGAYRLFFEAHVPALGWETYFVGPCLLTHWTLNYPLPASCAFVSAVLNTTEVLAQGLHNDRYGLRFSGCQLDGVVAKAQGGRSVDLKQSFQVYSSPGDSVYMFRPTDPPQPRALADCRLVGQVGPLVQEVQASSSSGISYSVRLVNGSSDGPMNRLIRLQHTVGGLAPFENLVTRLDTSLTASSYSLHENGYERRPAEYNASRSVGNNYKPFVSRAALSTPGGDVDLHVMGHAPHGTVSLGPGRMEFMLHRRAAYQPLRGNDESTAVLSPLWLVLDEPRQAEALATSWAALLQAPLTPVMATDPAVHVKSSWSALPASLPPSIHLLTLAEPTFPQPGIASVVLQLEHLVDQASGGQPVDLKVDLSEVLRLRKLGDRLVGAGGALKCQERTITTAYPISRLEDRLRWRTDEVAQGQGGPESCRVRQEGTQISLSIGPKDVCTVSCSV